MSADTIVQDPLDSQAFNRYSYVRNNPMMYTDPSGHSWWSKLKKRVKRAWRKVVGAVLIIVGVVVAFIPGWQTVGASIVGAGVSLYNYDKTGKFTFQAPIIETGGGGKGKNPAEQQDQIDAIQDEEVARAETLSGTQNNLGASSDNGKYANGSSTGSYGNTGASISQNNDGSINLGVITVTATSLPKGYAWIADLPDYGYTAFTFTPVGGVYDVLVQYDNGEIGMLGAAGLIGLSLVPGGRAGAKGIKFIHSTHVDNLIPTHGLTQSRNDFRDLTNDIYQNGINKPIVYVQDNGVKYIVDGHHRASVAGNLGIGNVPTIQVGLPYRGYETVSDLRYSDF